MEYRGINLTDTVKLYKKDGSFYKSIKNSLDDISDMLVKNGHELLNEYAGSSAKILIDYKCGHEAHLILPSHYKNGIGCPKCGRDIAAEKHSKLSKEYLINLMNKNGHELLSEYVNAKTKVLIDFKCNHDPHEITPDNYKYGQGCPKCGMISRAGKQSEEAKEDLIYLLEKNEHELLSEYINARTKILIDFKCGHKPHWIYSYYYKKGGNCPICSESKGEKRVREWLIKNGITFESQKEFNGLLGTGGGNLSYDFYLPKENILIEYQGEFHDGSSGEYAKANLEYHQEHDRRKFEFAKLHNITLLEIWYRDFDNVEIILENKLNEYHVIEVMDV